MLQKQDRQCFFTKKLMMLCMFLFFSLAAPESQEGIGCGTQQAESTRREEQREVSKRIWVIEQYDRVQPSLEDLWGLYKALNIGNETNLVKEHQVFKLRGGNGLYEPKLAVTDDYTAIFENIDRVKRIEERLKTDKECSTCLQEFTSIEGKGYIFVSGCNKEVPHIFHYNCYLWFKDSKKCPYCQGWLVDPEIEEMIRKNLTAKVFQTKQINHLEKITDNPSHWKLHIRDKTNDKERIMTTRIKAEEWVIVDEPVSESMDVLEINLDNPKDLEAEHITILEVFEFQNIKFNTDQEAREIFLVAVKHSDAQIYHKGRVVFVGNNEDCGECPIELRPENIGRKGNQSGYIYKRVGSFLCKVFVFNKENIDYLKETKSVVVFGNSHLGIRIGLKGDETIPKEDIENILIIKNSIRLVCDNLNHFSAMKAHHYSFLSPIDQSKLLQVKDMRGKPKIQIGNVGAVIREDDCFLIPLFDLSAPKDYILFVITCYMMEREDSPFQDNVQELNELFSEVKIRRDGLSVAFDDYAVILLLYFGKDALKVRKITIDILEGGENRKLDIIKGLIKHQAISKHQTQELNLEGELLDFAVETKIMENIKFQKLHLDTDENNIHDNLICKEGGLSGILNDLEELLLFKYAIKYLLQFKKGTNKINELKVSFEFKDNENYQWVFGVLERIRENGISFTFPSTDSWKVLGKYSEEIKSNLKDVITFSHNDLESY